MDEQSLNQLRYPIGKFQRNKQAGQAEIKSWIANIKDFPAKLKAETEGLSEDKLELIYRPGGWTVRQVIHHCADSHINAVVRLRLALTEETPTIKPYEEARWAELPDAADAPVALSLQLLEGLHARWAFLLERLTAEDFKKTFIHPETRRHISLKESLGVYSWHCQHHLAHIRQALRLKGKFE